MASLGGEPDDLAGIDDVVTPRNDDEDDDADEADSMRANMAEELVDFADRVPEVPLSAPGRLQIGVPPFRAAGLRESSAINEENSNRMQLSLQMPVRSAGPLVPNAPHPGMTRLDEAIIVIIHTFECLIPSRN
eukprot:scaffold394785_cov47-Prasinocladus_malaysianus.AAC.1